MDEIRNEDKTFPHNDQSKFGYERVSDWESVFWYSKKTFWDEPDFKIHRMPVQEAVERGILTVTCPEGILDDIKAHNALLEATRSSPMTDEEIEQIKFFAKSIDRTCSESLAFSAPIRTPDPTEQEIAEWREDYKKFCEMDIDALYIKYGVKLLMNESEWYGMGEVEEIHFDPKNRLQNDKYVDPLDWRARTAAYRKAQEEMEKEMGCYGWQRNYEESSVWKSKEEEGGFPQDDEFSMQQH